MITAFDDKPQSSFLDRFKPQENVTYLAFLPDWSRKVELSYHFIEGDSDTNGGMYACSKGDCCIALGAPGSALVIPIFVYTNPAYGADGQMFAWWCPRDIYQSLVALKKSYQERQQDVRWFDVQITSIKSGRGTRQQVALLPGQARIYGADEATKAICQEVFASLDAFYVQADVASVRTVAPGGWPEIFKKHKIVSVAPPMGNGRLPLAYAPQVPNGPAMIPQQPQYQPPPQVPQYQQPPPQPQYQPPQYQQQPQVSPAPPQPPQQSQPQYQQPPQVPVSPQQSQPQYSQQPPQIPTPPQGVYLPPQAMQTPPGYVPPPVGPANPSGSGAQQFNNPAGMPQPPQQPPPQPQYQQPPQQLHYQQLPPQSPDPGTVASASFEAQSFPGDELEALMQSDLPPGIPRGI